MIFECLSLNIRVQKSPLLIKRTNFFGRPFKLWHETVTGH